MTTYERSGIEFTQTSNKARISKILSGFTSLSDEILRLHKSRDGAPNADFRQRAALMAMGAYGERALTVGATINMAGLALSMERLVMYRVHPSVIEQVDATDLHDVASAPPRLLQGPFLAECAAPSKNVLFEDVVAVAGYQFEGAWYIIYWRYPDGCGVFEWSGEWHSEMKAEMGVVTENDSLVPNVEEWGNLARLAIRFAIVLGLLLDAEGTPVVVTTEKPIRPAAAKYGQKRPPPTGWEARYLRVPATVPPPGPAHADAPVTREGLGLLTVPVRGFLRRQPHGPNGSLHKWIYVAGHQARRWVSPRPVKIDVR